MVTGMEILNPRTTRALYLQSLNSIATHIAMKCNFKRQILPLFHYWEEEGGCMLAGAPQCYFNCFFLL